MEVHQFKIASRQSTDVDELRTLYRITNENLARIRKFGQCTIPVPDGVISDWYEWLETQPEYDRFLSEPDTVTRLKGLQRKYWEDFFNAEVDEGYVERRRKVGEAHARIGLPLNTYLAGMNMFLILFGPIPGPREWSDTERMEVQDAVGKLIHFDTAVVVETYNRLVEETLTAQSKSLMEMSTPVTQIWNGILLLPIVGIIDSRRARDIMNATLAKIDETQSRIFILDISGVGVVDTAVANHLIKITRATRLMGCESTISGVSPSIAQTVVDLGIDVGEVKTTATMEDALADAFQRVGLEITQKR